MHVQRPVQVGPGFKGHSLHLRLQVHNIQALCRPLHLATHQQRTQQGQHALQSSANWVLARPPSSVSQKRRRRQGLHLQAVSITALGQPEPPKSTAAPVDSLLRSRHDRDILGLAVPALASILLDPLMSVVDTGTLLLSNAAMLRLHHRVPYMGGGEGFTSLASHLAAPGVTPSARLVDAWCPVALPNIFCWPR